MYFKNVKIAGLLTVLGVILLMLSSCKTDVPNHSDSYNQEETLSMTDSNEKSHDIEQGELEEEESKVTYTHTALCGAVITEQDGRSLFFYKNKCEKCGETQPGEMGSSGSYGILRSGFVCVYCHKHQDVEIQSTPN